MTFFFTKMNVEMEGNLTLKRICFDSFRFPIYLFLWIAKEKNAKMISGENLA